jgi:hypothetical protein
MGLLKSLGDKLEEAREELGEKVEEKRRRAQLAAVEKAAEVALKKGVAAAQSAVAETSQRIEDALFGDESAENGPPPVNAAGSPAAARALSSEGKEPEPKAPSAEERAARFDREIDDELEALKRKIAREP